MADEQVQVTDDRVSTNLQTAVWGDAPVDVAEPPVTDKPVEAPVVEAPKNDNTEVFDENVYIKNHFGYDNLDAAKREIEELRQKANKPFEPKFENDFSDKVYKALQSGDVKTVSKMLAQQDRLEELTALEVNKDNAADIIKMNMQLKNPALSKAEIDFQFEQDYTAPKEPKEPKQRASETDEEFAERMDEYKDAHGDWKRVVDNIDMRKSIAAKMAKPELEAAKSKIVFPESQTSQGAPKPTQEELDAFKKHQEVFVQSASSILNGFNGFTAQVKDKDVDYSVSYVPSQEEKATIDSVIKRFAEDGFNPNAIFVDRWVKEDGTLNVDQMVKDVSRIYTGDKAEVKIANDAANKRLELYLKDKKNINVNGDGSNRTFVPDAKTQSEKVQEAFWGTN